MLTRKRVFVLDDEVDIVAQLKETFELSTEYDFEVITCTTLQECVTSPYVNDLFDVFIVDLRLSTTAAVSLDGNNLEGFLLLLSRSELRDVEYRIVYTAHATPHNIVRAMQLGATDCLSKDEFTIGQLVKRVEATMRERELQAIHRQLIRAFVMENLVTWEAERPGEVLAISVDPATQEVRLVARGASRLESLVNYSKVRMSESGPSRLPLDPHLHLVPKRVG